MTLASICIRPGVRVTPKPLLRQIERSSNGPSFVCRICCILPPVHQNIDLAAVAEVRVHTQQPIANMGLPSFHPLGIVCQLLQPLSGTPVAVYTPTATSSSSLPILPTPDNILEHARKTKCRSLTTVPAHLAIWFNSSDAVAYLATLHTIVNPFSILPMGSG